MNLRWLAPAMLAAAGAAAEPARPNILAIVVDDLGWNDPGFAGNPLRPTPHLDALAQRGAVCTASYAAAPNCAPTRACLLTGRYAPRHGVYTVADERFTPGQPWQRLLAATTATQLPAEGLTIPRALAAGGYASAMIGQWNLGRGRSGPGSPTGQGFTWALQTSELGFGPDTYWNEAGACSTDLLTDRAIAFVREHRGQPWFLYLAYHAVHAPFKPKPELLARFQGAGADAEQAGLAATLADLDGNVQRLLDALDADGAAAATFVMVTGDNGGLDRTVRPLRGGKGTLYEGGIRVPLLVCGPGIPAGARLDGPVSSIDWLPTIQAMAGLPAPAGQQVDGIDLLPALRGSRPLPERTLYWHFPCYVGKGVPSSALREGRYKAVQDLATGAVAVYDLVADPGEARDLAPADAALASRLGSRLADWQRSTAAAMPPPNPAYDPAARQPRGGRGQPQGKEPR